VPSGAVDGSCGLMVRVAPTIPELKRAAFTLCG